MELLSKIEETVLNHSVEEIMFDNLRAYYGCFDLENVTYNTLRSRYLTEEFDELNRSLEYFETNIQDIQKNIQNYKKVYQILVDEKSRTTYASMMAAKLFMNIDYVNNVYSNEKTYFSKNIFSFSDETYIDCGGYDGDTAVEFWMLNQNIRHMYIFEGIPELAEQCRLSVQQYGAGEHVTVFQNAVFNKKCKLYFNLGKGDGDSKINVNGEIEVSAVRIDDIINEKVTFIKMDIEGSEKEALMGAKEIISKYTPKMAICIYHLEDDFWKIPELVTTINPNYCFKVRQHAPACFSETVLYCIPKDMENPDGEDIQLKKEEQDLVSYRKARAWFLKQLRCQKFELERSHLYADALIDVKNYFLRQIEYKDEKIKALEDWIEELEKGKAYLETQIKLKDERILNLENIR